MYIEEIIESINKGEKKVKAIAGSNTVFINDTIFDMLKEAIAKSGQITHFTWDTPLNHKDCMILLGSLHNNRALQEVNLQNFSATDDQINFIVALAAMPKMKKLILNKNCFSNEGLRELVKKVTTYANLDTFEFSSELTENNKGFKKELEGYLTDKHLWDFYAIQAKPIKELSALQLVKCLYLHYFPENHALLCGEKESFLNESFKEKVAEVTKALANTKIHERFCDAAKVKKIEKYLKAKFPEGYMPSKEFDEMCSDILAVINNIGKLNDAKKAPAIDLGSLIVAKYKPNKQEEKTTSSLSQPSYQNNQNANIELS